MANLLRIRHVGARLAAAFASGALLLVTTNNVIQLAGSLFDVILPTGALTGVLGVPLLIYLVLHQRKAQRDEAQAPAGQYAAVPPRRMQGRRWLLLGAGALLALCVLAQGFAANLHGWGWLWDVGLIAQHRLPRSLSAMATGAMLAVGGVLLQTLTRNPMASPEVLGISSGAALAVANKIPAKPLCLAGIFYGAWWTGVVEGSLFIATPVSLCRLRALAVGGLVGLAPGGCAPHELKTINPLGGVDAVDALAYKHLAGGVSKGLARCALGQHFKRG